MKGKKILAALAFTLLGSSSSWAILGGPWDHLNTDKYSQNNVDGLYEGSVTMPNGSGFLRFSQETGRENLANPVVQQDNQDLFFGTSTTNLCFRTEP